jgi:hypothetical protein
MRCVHFILDNPKTTRLGFLSKSLDLDLKIVLRGFPSGRSGCVLAPPGIVEVFLKDVP